MTQEAAALQFLEVFPEAEAFNITILTEEKRVIVARPQCFSPMHGRKRSSKELDWAETIAMCTKTESSSAAWRSIRSAPYALRSSHVRIFSLKRPSEAAAIVDGRVGDVRALPTSVPPPISNAKTRTLAQGRGM